MNRRYCKSCSKLKSRQNISTIQIIKNTHSLNGYYLEIARTTCRLQHKEYISYWAIFAFYTIYCWRLGGTGLNIMLHDSKSSPNSSLWNPLYPCTNFGHQNCQTQRNANIWTASHIAVDLTVAQSDYHVAYFLHMKKMISSNKLDQWVQPHWMICSFFRVKLFSLESGPWFHDNVRIW